MIASVNSSMGLVLINNQEVITNEERILEYIPKLVECMGGDAFALFMDNLACHKTPAVMEMYQKYNILPIFNIADSPDLNPIEVCFSFVKLSYKQQWLNACANNIEFDKDEAIDKAFNKITPELVKHSVGRSVYLLHKA